MAGTRTAPATTALDVSYNAVGLSLVDASGDLWSESVKTPGGAILDNADIEAFATAYQAATQASLYEVRQTIVWQGSINPANANALFRAGGQNGVNLSYHDTDVFNAIANQRLISPVAAIMVGNTDTPVFPLIVPMSTLNDAYITLLGAGYSLETLQYTARRERRNNTKIRT